MDRRFTKTIVDVQKQAVASNDKLQRGQLELFEKLFWSRPATFGFSVSSHQPAGWQVVTVGNQDSSTSVLVAPAAGVALGAAMVLPALAKAKAKAQSITCVNNMKQIGLAARIWAGDHNDKFPFNVSTNNGGTLELCERDADGYDRNAARHFQVMSNELNTPKILVCPDDKSKQVADSFKNLDSWNVSYQLRTGDKVNDTNPEEVLIYCPIHHHTLQTDGSVLQGKKTGKTGI